MGCADMKSMVIVALSLFAPLAAFSADADSKAGHKHVTLFLGAGQENKPGKNTDAYAAGLEYQYRIDDHWGIGVIGEYLDVDFRGNVVVVVPVSYMPFGGDFRLFAGPGYEFKQNIRKDKWLIRLGTGYDIRLDEHWSIAPEAMIDYLDGYGSTWLVGVAIGYRFH